MRLTLSAILLFLFTACASSPKGDESRRFNAFLDDAFNEFLDKSPESLTSLGIKKHYGRLNDYTEKFSFEMQELGKKHYAKLLTFDRAKLGPQEQLSYDLVKKDYEDNFSDFQWRHYRYHVEQLYGIHSELPAMMMSMHRVDTEQDLKDYISRLREFQRVLNETVERMAFSESAGVVPPKFVFPYVIDASRNVIKGAPFGGKGDSPLYEDFRRKLSLLKLDETKRKSYLKEAEQALLKEVKGGYDNLIAALKSQQKRAQTTAGVWRFPRGGEFYKMRVARATTTDMTPDQIHELGLKNVARLQEDMKKTMVQLGFKGSLKDFFKELRQNDKYYFPNTEQGRQAYLDLANSFYKNVQNEIPRFFRLRPKAGFEIRAVEKFRENSAGVAFYQGPSEDGSRPGVYYVNLKEMKNLPKHETEVVLYHEGAPGHHFQIALAQELTNLPLPRRYAHYTAFSEGWGLYTERLAKEMGAYKDPLSEFGRLSLEILRAGRLVVDTGLHHKKWTREQALKYFNDNIPGALDDQKNEIERYIVMPGQATAYMIGMLKIYELRENAKAQLGDKFDIRDFHDLVLGNGPLPLSQLEQLVSNYIARKKAA